MTRGQEAFCQVGRVQKDELVDARSIRLTQLDQLHAGSGMADEYGLVDTERVEDRDVVRRPGLNVVAVRRLARGKPSPAGDADDVKVGGELERELVVHVRVVAGAREQHHRLACTAPVDHLQVDSAGYGCDR